MCEFDQYVASTSMNLFFVGPTEERKVELKLYELFNLCDNLIEQCVELNS